MAVTGSWVVLAALAALPDSPSSPLVGPVGGLHVGLSAASAIAPDLGARAGVRLRLGEHAALSLFADADLIWIDWSPPQSATSSNRLRPPRTPLDPLFAQRLVSSARIELISSSASTVMLVPKLTAGLALGAGVIFAGGEVAVAVLSGGLHLGLTRLDPSGWWFPVSLDLGLEGSPGGSTSWRLVFGVGL